MSQNPSVLAPGAPRTAAIPQLDGIAFVELYVENPLQAMQFYRSLLGFRPVGYAGLETGVRDRSSFMIEQADIRLVLSGPLTNDGSVTEYLRSHGEGVKDVAFAVGDLNAAIETLEARGASLIEVPNDGARTQADLRRVVVRTPGDFVHSLVEWPRDGSPLLPQYQRMDSPPSSVSTGLCEIDHVAICVGADTLEEWVEFYRRVFGFEQVHHEDVLTEHSGMCSRVVGDASGRIKFPLVAPAPGRKNSQINEYLRYNGGVGVQHVALSCTDIVASTRALKENSLQFLQVPAGYFDVVGDRVGEFSGDMAAMRELGIMIDRDSTGVLMQTFTKPLQPRPTLFLELIQRDGAHGFGSGNIRALFEAVERQQALRGNL
jgi:4-hydroxyphenylpyruvate dioxygenase